MLTEADNAPRNLTPLESSITNGTWYPRSNRGLGRTRSAPADGASSAGQGQKGAGDANKVG